MSYFQPTTFQLSCVREAGVLYVQAQHIYISTDITLTRIYMGPEVEAVGKVVRTRLRGLPGRSPPRSAKRYRQNFQQRFQVGSIFCPSVRGLR